MAKKVKAAGATKKPRALTVDFTGIEGRRKGARRIKEGDYLFEVTDYRMGQKGQDEEKQFLAVDLKILKGPSEGKFGEIFGLQKTQLWRLFNFMEALGFKVESSRQKLPLEKITGRKFGGTVADHEYDNKKSSQIQDWFTAKEYEEIDSEEEDEDEDEEEEEEDVADAATDDDEEEDEEELELVDDDI